jgi:hypothetical protein
MSIGTYVDVPHKEYKATSVHELVGHSPEPAFTVVGGVSKFNGKSGVMLYL